MTHFGRCLMLTFLALMLGCAGMPASPTQRHDDLSLTAWIDARLADHLAQNLGRHPRFKGRPVLIVKMKGDDVAPAIDDLTRDIRDRLLTALRSAPGVQIAWRPSVRPWRHHRRPTTPACGESAPIDFYVGIDPTLSADGRTLSVKVGVLNLESEQWEQRLFRSWRGAPTDRQRAALSRTRPDPYLRGLRPLPFEGDAPDLAAAYLARNLTCLLKERTTDRVTVYAAPEAAGRDFAGRVLGLVFNYLDRFREIEPVGDPSRANTRLRVTAHRIDGDLHQVWLTARCDGCKPPLTGIAADAYVTIDERSPAPPPRADDRRPPARVDPPQERRPPERERERDRVAPDPSPLIASFSVVAPMIREFCATDAPWALGEQTLRSGVHLPGGSCVAIEVAAAASARFYLIGQDGRGRLTRLFPGGCAGSGPPDNVLAAGESLRFPPLSGPDAGVLELSDDPGEERVYAVAIADEGTARDFERKIDAVPGACEAGKGIELAGGADPALDRPGGWEAYLADLIDRSGGRAAYRVFGFVHE